jgi:hypothetical protein
MEIPVSVANPAACNRDVNDLVWGLLDHEFHFLS